MGLDAGFYVLRALCGVHRVQDLQPTHVAGIPVEIHTVLPVAALAHRSVGAELLLGFRGGLLLLGFGRGP